MTWPNADASTTNTDSDSDSPASARADLKDLIDKFNQIRSHVASFSQTLINFTATSSARQHLGITTPSSYLRVPVLLARNAAQTNVVSTATETTVFSYAVPANLLGTSRMLRLTLFGDQHNSSGSSMYQMWRVRFGGTLIGSLGFNLSSGVANSRREVQIYVDIMPFNVTSNQIAAVTMHQRNSATTSESVLAAPNRPFTLTSSLALDTTSSQVLAVTAQNTVGNANANMRVHSVLLELI